MRTILTIGTLVLFGTLLATVAVRDTHAAYCHSKVSNAVWEVPREGVDYAFLMPADGGKVLLVEEVTAQDECFGEWEAIYSRAPSGRRLMVSAQRATRMFNELVSNSNNCFTNPACAFVEES